MLPQFCKNMKPTDTEKFALVIDRFFSSSELTWSKINIGILLEHVELKDMGSLYVSYWTVKRNTSVIFRVREEVINSDSLLEVAFDEYS